jgi:hypothetical protein
MSHVSAKRPGGGARRARGLRQPARRVQAVSSGARALAPRAAEDPVRRSRLALLLLVALVAGLVGARLYLPIYVRDYVNGVLERNGDYTGRVADVDLALWRGAARIRALEIVKRNGEVPVPLLELPEAAASLEWGALLRHGELVLEVDVLSPALHLVAAPTPEEQQYGEGGRWQETIEALTPIRIDRLGVRDGRVHYHDFHSEPKVDVALSDLALVAENLTNIRDPEDPLPAHARLEATPMTAGRLVVTADMDPLARLPRFDVDVELTGMELRPWNDFLRAYAGVDAEAGTIALFAELEARDGRFDGYLKPFVEDLDVLRLDEEQDEQSPLATAWEALVGATAELLENQPTERLATRVPISGTVEQPETEFWPTFVNVLRNAFVEAFAPRLGGRSALGD